MLPLRRALCFRSLCSLAQSEPCHSGAVSPRRERLRREEARRDEDRCQVGPCRERMLREELAAAQSLSESFASLGPPEELSEELLSRLGDLPSRSTRLAFLRHAARKRRRKEKDAGAKAARPPVAQDSAEEVHGDLPNRLLVSGRQSERERAAGLAGVFRAARLGSPTLCLEGSFFRAMNPHQRELTAVQLRYVAALNQAHAQPGLLSLASTPSDEAWWAGLETSHLTYRRDPLRAIALQHETRSVPELYPSKRIVVLSPDARDVLTRWDDEAVYVVGALVDKGPFEPRQATLNLAKAWGAEARRLPLDRYLPWQRGSKFLTLDQVVGLCLDLALSGDARRATLRAVPHRKVTTEFPPNRSKALAKRRQLIDDFSHSVLQILRQRLQ